MAAGRDRRYRGAMKVHEIMTAHARCIGPENTLVEAAGLMRELDVGALPVLENDELAGMLTDRDLVVRAIADGRDPNATPVRDVMSPGAMFVLADQEVEEAVRVMQQRQVRRLPVLNRARRLVGIVSLGDVAVASHPAFGGLALRDVSESDRTLSHRGAKTPVATANRGIGLGRDGTARDGDHAGARDVRSRSDHDRAAKTRAGKTKSRRSQSGGARRKKPVESKRAHSNRGAAAPAGKSRSAASSRRRS